MILIKRLKKIVIIAIVILLIILVFISKKYIVNERENLKQAEKEVEIRNHDFKIYFFIIDNCPACEYMLPIYNKIKEIYKDKLDFEKVDVNYNIKLSSKYVINEVPTLIIVDIDGKVKKRKLGVIKEEELINMIEGVINND